MSERRSGNSQLALGSLMMGAGLGGTILTVNVYLVRLSQAGIVDATDRTSPTTIPSFLAIGAVAAFVAAAGLAFWRARVFGTRWQRIAIGVLSPTAAMFLAALAMPLDAAFNRAGIGALAIGCLAIMVAGSRIAKKGESTS